MIRPANYMTGNPGRGSTVVSVGDRRVGVVNLSGSVQLKVARSPFPEADAIVERLRGEVDAVIVDFHAEVTSEKIAMGWHLDGRVAAVLGTHTHVPTADARVLPGGTAFITDVGMTGSRAGVIGVRREQALESFRTQMPVKFDTADEDVWVNGVVVDVRDDGLANSIEQVLVPAYLGGRARARGRRTSAARSPAPRASSAPTCGRPPRCRSAGPAPRPRDPGRR